jgi:hypothetical protein
MFPRNPRTIQKLIGPPHFQPFLAIGERYSACTPDQNIGLLLELNAPTWTITQNGHLDIPYVRDIAHAWNLSCKPRPISHPHDALTALSRNTQSCLHASNPTRSLVGDTPPMGPMLITQTHAPAHLAMHAHTFAHPQHAPMCPHTHNAHSYIHAPINPYSRLALPCNSHSLTHSPLVPDLARVWALSTTRDTNLNPTPTPFLFLLFLFASD